MEPDSDTPPRSRVAGALAAGWVAVMGALPHVLHHVGPLAGAAIVAGTTGTIVFGLLAFVLTIPLLLRMRRHCGSWHRPLALLAVFVLVWVVSTWVVGPQLRDALTDDPPAVQEGEPADVEDEEHDAHHSEDA